MASLSVILSNTWKKIYSEPVKAYTEKKLYLHRLQVANGIKKDAAENFDKQVVIVRTDDIGDYILFRNTLAFVRKKYVGYKITLIGHQLWRSLAESWDTEFVDEFIWLDKGKFNNDENYYKEFLKKGAALKPELLIAPSFSRNSFIDEFIAIVINAKEKVALQRNNYELRKWLRQYVDAPYTRIIPYHKPFWHEFELNKYIVGGAIREEIHQEKAEIDKSKLEKISDLPEKYVVLFPGTAAERKRWKTKYFARLADFIIEKYGINVVIPGAAGDKKYADKIISESKNSDKIISYTGKTTLPQLASVLNQSLCVVANDTGAAHITASLGKKMVALLIGRSYGRFFPYPAQYKDIIPVYPDYLLNKINKNKAAYYDWTGMADVQDISPEQAMAAIEKLLG